MCICMYMCMYVCACIRMRRPVQRTCIAVCPMGASVHAVYRNKEMQDLNYVHTYTHRLHSFHSQFLPRPVPQNPSISSLHRRHRAVRSRKIEYIGVLILSITFVEIDWAYRSTARQCGGQGICLPRHQNVCVNYGIA